MTEFSNDSGWLVIWNDIKNGGFPLFLIMLFFILYFLKPYASNILTFIGKLIKGKIEKHTTCYTADDVKNHPIFKDLDFWLSVGIKSLKMSNLNVQFPMLKLHKESADYLKAKEEIAKDVLTVKFTVIKEYIHNFIGESDLATFDLITAKKHIETYLTKCEVRQYNDMVELGIPDEFLKKYFVYEKMSVDLLKKTIVAYLDDQCFDLDTPTRIYLIFTALNNYLTEAFETILYTVASINGDLNGVEYKGHIIGDKKTKILQPPHASFVYPAKEKLKEIRAAFGASRAGVIKYYKKNGLMYHSCVYEECDAGVKSVLAEVQEIPATDEKDAIDILQNGTIIAVDISKFNNYIANRLSQRGVDAIILVPIIEGEDLSALLVLDYLSLEEFNVRKKTDKLDERLKAYANDLKPYITYPVDYEY